MSTSTATVMSNANTNNNDDGTLGAANNSVQESCAYAEHSSNISVVFENFSEKDSKSSSMEQNMQEIGSQVELSACANKITHASDSLNAAVSRKVGYAPIKQE